MSGVTEAIVSTAVGMAFVVVARLVDRFLPDTTGQHPLPSQGAPPAHPPPAE